MASQYDLELAVNGDINITDNDFTYVLSDPQHIQDTIIASPLWWKQFPADGVGITSYLNSAGRAQQLMGAIKKQLQADGYNCSNPLISTSPDGTLNINPNAIRL